jgi:hypothetical protein
LGLTGTKEDYFDAFVNSMRSTDCLRYTGLNLGELDAPLRTNFILQMSDVESGGNLYKFIIFNF